MGESKNISMMPAFNEKISISSMVLRARKKVNRVLVIADG